MRYSQALRQADIVWDERTLDRYLADPRLLVPGTTMTVALRSEGERAAVIAYLRELPAGN